MYQNDLYVSWDEFQDRCVDLAYRIKAEGRTFDKILCVTRGGLFATGILSRELNIKAIENVGIAAYAGKQAQDIKKPVFIKKASPEFLENALVIEDLVDTGSTLRFLKPHTKNCMFVAVFAKPEGEDQLDLFQRGVPQDTWVRFPWDTRRRYVDPLIGE
ncbi:MAG: xanthine phosphoribosyltransferase [Alphaproteobacteria bacterium]|nr:xanthine phosphoribosyltransferase [Alphaproteobacteria bacterium]